MDTRLVQHAEWSTWTDPELQALVRHLPADAVVVAVLEQDEIVGTWAAFQRWHVDGLNIKRSHRKRASVGRRLFLGMGRLLTAVNASTAITFAQSTRMRKMLAKVGGTKVPATCYVLPITGD